RLAEPHRLVPMGRRWYLVAYDLHRHDWRSFRLDRLTAPRRTGARFRPRELPTSDAAEFVRTGIRTLTSTHAVEVLVHAPAPAVRDKLGRWATVEELAGDHRAGPRCVLRMSVESLDWPMMALGALGAEFEVRSPPELTELVREWGARFSRAAG
ncbi:WYL domain-containing protein, partial [Pseudonocardia asaccharolytica]